jgi:hypothetical protein
MKLGGKDNKKGCKTKQITIKKGTTSDIKINLS